MVNYKLIFIYINLGILTTLGANFKITDFCNNTIDLQI